MADERALAAVAVVSSAQKRTQTKEKPRRQAKALFCTT